MALPGVLVAEAEPALLPVAEAREEEGEPWAALLV